MILASLHSLDLEYAAALTKAAEEHDRSVYVTSTELATLLKRLPQANFKPYLIEEYAVDIFVQDIMPMVSVEPNSLILTSLRDTIDFLRNVESRMLTDATVILSEPEPPSEEMSEYDVVANWMSRLNVQAYRIRVSGHYYPYQLKMILKTLKPKKVKIVHTRTPRLSQQLVSSIMEEN